MKGFISGNYAKHGSIVPDFILKVPGLTQGSRLLYGILCDCSGHKHCCWPSQAYLAWRTGQCVRSVQNHLKKLAKAGFIDIRKRPFRGNKYYLLEHPAAVRKSARKASPSRVPSYANLAPVAPAPVSAPMSACEAGGGVGERDAHNSILKKGKKSNTPPYPPKSSWRAEAEAAFQRVWEVWPVREARQSALRLWRRLWRSEERPQLDVILDSIKDNLARNPRWKRGFVPFLAKWLRGRRWEDALPSGITVSQVQGAAPAMESQVKAGRQREEGGGERNSGLSLGNVQRGESVPEIILKDFEAAVSIWPVNLTDGQMLQARGLWRFLYEQRKLPSLQDIILAAQATSQQFIGWLHGYKELQST